MPAGSSLRLALKRGVLLVAANWPVVVVQFVAESTFKLMLAVPLLGGASLVALLLGAAAPDLGRLDPREAAAVIAASLAAQPVALAAFLLAFGLVVLGGSALMFLVKAGTVAVLAAGEAAAGPIEHPPLRLAELRRAGRFDSERFLAGIGRFGRRFLALGVSLLAVYAASGAAYFLIVVRGLGAAEGALVGWTLLAALGSSALIVWVTLVNLLYLLTQMVIVVDDRRIRSALGQVFRFVRGCGREVAAVFGLVLLLVVLATVASILAAAGLGLIAFVPLVGLAVVPLQVAAWLLRGLVFQYLGLAALGAYLSQYRAFLRGRASPWVRTA